MMQTRSDSVEVVTTSYWITEHMALLSSMANPNNLCVSVVQSISEPADGFRKELSFNGTIQFTGKQAVPQ